MPLPPTLSLPTLILVAVLTLLTTAQTGGSRLDSGQCPPDAEAQLVYSPFQPYFTWYPNNTKNKCWTAADCLFEAAGESRKQQFAATALVMGLIPLTLKDIAWPERRLIHITSRLAFPLELLVLALGLVPLETGSRAETRARSRENNMLARKAWRMGRGRIVGVIAACGVGVVASYVGLVCMEVYSKRSALGCPFPAFVACWYVVALVPAGIHAVFAALRRRRQANRPVGTRSSAKSDHEAGFVVAPLRAEVERDEEDVEKKKNKKTIVSAVQGADEDWPVQMAWGVYYIAGTLVFTSIMAVTVVELVCWVGLGFAVTGWSKVLAFFLCLVFEETGRRGEVVDEMNE
ncbi:hypothetical protein CC80DRAFT_494166 [Byssothecium circinans]|uniref:Uncharacterized protein n=1 Tax=Byssothecium circinans TaxID=147558 RepID=A0A6A5TNX6_9PLEO|nr:hypothetical protein CC80DRAFT_494166 [Byssothecium circinans]